MTPPKRGALYIVWSDKNNPRPEGDRGTEIALQRSIESLATVHPELEIDIIRMEEGASLLDKAEMFEMSKFDSTVYLDADTVILGRLDFGFEQAEKHGLACCICECPSARRYGGLADKGDIIEYNTGVLFFNKSVEGVRDVFNSWRADIDIDSSLRFMTPDGPATMPLNDQAAFAHAIHITGFNPSVLPLNWNFRPIWQKTAFGPIKIWHDYSDVPPAVRGWNASQAEPGAILQCAAIGMTKQEQPAAQPACKFPDAPYQFTGDYSGCYANRATCVDERHVYTIFEILTSWPFMHALELGSFEGASATAMVEAQKRDPKMSIACCDLHITPSLRRVIRSEQLPSSVQGRRTVHTAKSAQVLGDDVEYDFIFVDANHDMASVSEELGHLLRRKPLCIMAHDTNATNAGFSHCEGAAHLADVFRKHPDYKGMCIEDSVRRAGEGTHRGLFFATTNEALFKIAKEAFAKWCPVNEEAAACA